MSFQKINNETNWCYFEYEEYKKNNYNCFNLQNDNCFFILTDKLSYIKPSNIPTQYAEWFNEIKDTKFTVLDHNNSFKIRNDLHDLANKVAELCKKKKSILIESVISYLAQRIGLIQKRRDEGEAIRAKQ